MATDGLLYEKDKIDFLESPKTLRYFSSTQARYDTI